MGNAYMHRRSESDFFETAFSLTKALSNTGEFEDLSYFPMWEPARGNDAITKVLRKRHPTLDILSSDITDGVDFFVDQGIKVRSIITNPPFSLFDEFVIRAKELVRKFAFIGKLNYFAAYQRHKAGIWANLKHVYAFNRQIDMRGPIYEDGSFHVGGVAYAWFVWDMSWSEEYWNMSILDVQQYATRGPYKP